jgi:hypothetical protein
MITLHGNVLTESLPSSGYTRHTILVSDMVLYKFPNDDTEISHIFGNDEDCVGYGFCSHIIFGKCNEFENRQNHDYIVFS